MSKEQRFEVIYEDGSSMKKEGARQILVDKETGVNYLVWQSGYAGGITPLLDSKGNPVIQGREQENEMPEEPPVAQSSNEAYEEDPEKLMEEPRPFMASYHKRLQKSLADRDIFVPGPSLKGMGDYKGIFTVEARGALFAMPNHGVGIHCIQPGSDAEFVEEAKKLFQHGVLALASDGQNLYGLTNDGKVLSSEIGWVNIILFDKLEEIQRIADATFPPETRDVLIEEIQKGKHWSYGKYMTTYYYDHEQKAFIEKTNSGNVKEGIYTNYSLCSREKLLEMMLQGMELRDVAEGMGAGKYPPILIAAALPMHEPGATIHVPERERLY